MFLIAYTGIPGIGLLGTVSLHLAVDPGFVHEGVACCIGVYVRVSGTFTINNSSVGEQLGNLPLVLLMCHSLDGNIDNYLLNLWLQREIIFSARVVPYHTGW